MITQDEKTEFEKFDLFSYKRDILHFAIGIFTGVGVVLFVAFEKIMY